MEVEVTVRSAKNTESVVVYTNQGGKHVLVDLAEKVNASGGGRSDVSMRVVCGDDVLIEYPDQREQKVPTPDGVKVVMQQAGYTW